ncbi:hypothetical protein CAPTEDRAFT_153237 [Capitella teleta]|uniref:PCI domain-containing protein n=1 Tax=Capitella teleta TaxID=283909 RepID=R7VA27_CAPTE|nr:hypothetical protein CAPTEDRAFT_153237 [Capitella teleta]|eukprot:ELU15663.1 hypothetical protein CAPTEDRAFT_153237 [Capitella teleta]
MKKELEVVKPNLQPLKNPKKMKEDPQDVEMKDEEKSDATSEAPKKDADLLTVEDIKEYIRQVEKSVSSKEPRFVLRALRALVSLRRRLNPSVLRRAIMGYFPASDKTSRDTLIEFLGEIKDSDETPVAPTQRPRSSRQIPLPEVDVYLHLLTLLYLIDNQLLDKAVCCSDLLMAKVKGHNRRTLDVLAARCYFYHGRTYELTDQLDKLTSLLHSRLRTCTLRSDFEGQATLLNLLLRNYLRHSLYDQADKLVSKSAFPESASNNEWARYLFYLGQIKAIQLEYSEAHRHLVQATRKAPQHTAVGFKQIVQKFAITVELLLGDIPDRAIFRHHSMKKTLQPYFQLTQAVRIGSLSTFNKVLEAHGSRFQKDGTYTLIIRLRHNVIKTGVRMINLSYSRISLADVASKLMLDSAEDAEFIVAKAIRDGVIEATIEHEQGFVRSKEHCDIYSTREPLDAFHQRITFCLNTHNQSIKAMRFPPKSYNKDLESAEERREREQQELEYAKEIDDEEFDRFP